MLIWSQVSLIREYSDSLSFYGTRKCFPLLMMNFFTHLLTSKVTIQISHLIQHYLSDYLVSKRAYH